MAEWLSGEGHTVIVCHDPMAAAQIALDVNPGLAIIDYQMPGKNGVELLADLRAIEETQRLPVLFFSGTDTVRYAHKVPAEPRVRFLAKPVDMGILTTVIREMLDPNIWSSPV